MASFLTEFNHLEIQLEDIILATNNFDESKVIGRGGFGKVYLGELSLSQSAEKSLVAIKRLDRRCEQGDPEFFKEIRMLSCYRHENLISLLGFCCQGASQDMPGYCDPLYMETYQLTKESDVYSFGVVLFEVLCGRQCVEFSNGRQPKIFVPFWKQSYVDNKLKAIVLKDIKQQMNQRSLEIFGGIAYQCLQKSREQRPTMSLVVEKLEVALQTQMLLKEEPLEQEETSVPLKEGFKLDKDSGKICCMLGAKDISIAWHDDTRYWQRGHVPESRFGEVAILREVWWLDICGIIPSVMLSPQSTYVAYLVFQITRDSMGLDEPAKTTVSFGGIRKETSNVYLKQPHRDEAPTHVFATTRKDGWMEIKLGEIYHDHGDEGEIEMKFQDHRSYIKKGLIVEGIELRPK
ncbi:F-box domain, phloem protein 2-like protein [Tanacetum coccineum]